MKRLSLVLPVAFALLSLACSDDEVASDGGGGSGESADSSDSVGSETGDGDGDGDGDGEIVDFGPVRGDLLITSIEVSQALAQPLYQAGAEVAPADYGVALINNRYTIFRALWDTPDGWTPRPLIARLHIQQPDGTEVVFVDYQTSQGESTIVDSSSSASDLFSSFFWRLDPEYVVPGMRYKISIWEAESGAESIPESSGGNEYPSSAFAPIGIEPEPSEIRIALVGVRYETESCVSDTTELPPDQFEALRAGFEAWNGVGTNSVIIDTGLDITIDSPVSSVTNLLGVVGQIRGQFAEEIPDAFFYILWDDCSVVSQGILGIAPVNNDPPEIGDAATRYAAGLWNPNDVRESVNTAVHEVGHNQGAPHAPCGVGGGTDPDFPHPGASIGVRGLDPLDGTTYSPNVYTDFMSYCRPYWVSDYRWNKSYNHQKIITSWSAGEIVADAPVIQGYAGAVLVGLVRADGAADWWINTRPRPPKVDMIGELQVEIQVDGASVAVARRIKQLPDLPGARLVEIPLVDGIDIDSITGIRVHGAAIDVVQASPAIRDFRELKISGEPFAKRPSR